MSIEPNSNKHMNPAKLAIYVRRAFQALQPTRPALQAYGDPFCVSLSANEQDSVVAVQRANDKRLHWVHTFGVDAVTGNVTLNGTNDRGLWTAAVDKCGRIDNYVGAVNAIVLFMETVPPETEEHKRNKELFFNILYDTDFRDHTMTQVAQP